MIQLRRITSSGRFVPEIDGLRFIAIASVVLYHFHGYVAIEPPVAALNDSIRPLAVHGYRGVNLFYLISGFILGLPFAAHHLRERPAVSLRAYFLRRLTRLEAPYILNLLICFAAAVYATGQSPAEILPHLGASLLYLHTFIYGAQNLINPVAWTLEVEVQFYCLVPLLAGVFRIRSKLARRATLAAAILLAGVLQSVAWDSPARIKMSIAFAIQFFLAGFLLLDIYLLDWNERPQRQWPWDVLSLLLWPVIFGIEDRSGWILLPFAMVGASCAAFTGPGVNRVLTHPAVTAIGGMCYSIYLFHYVLIQPLLFRTRPLNLGETFNSYFVTQALFYIPIMLLVSTTYFVLIERPCMVRDWPQRLLRQFRRNSSSRTPWYPE